MERQQVVVKLTQHQVLRCEKLGECLWPGEKLSVEEIGRRLLLEYLLGVESERGWLRTCEGKGRHRAQGFFWRDALHLVRYHRHRRPLGTGFLR